MTQEIETTPTEATVPKPKKIRHAGHKRLLSDREHLACRKLYVNSFLMPRVVALELNKQFGTTYTTQQITEYVRARGWSAKRKRDKELVLDTEPETESSVVVPPTRDLAAKKEHQDFLDKSAAVGAKILKRAEQMIERAVDSKTLASAANAAKTGIEMYRKAVGLEETGAKAQTNIFNLHFANSPFDAKPAEPAQSDPAATAATVDAVLVDEEEEAEEAAQSEEETDAGEQPAHPTSDS